MMLEEQITLRCTGCGKEYPFGTYTCENRDGVLFAEYELGKVRSIADIMTPSEQGIWRFAKVLPNVENRVTFGEGGTPCLLSRSLGPQLGITLYIKDEGRNPTGSFKDRASALLISTEKMLGHKECTTGSSGNAAGSLALYSQLGRMHLYVFMYHPTREKFLHTASFEPTIFLVDTPVESDVHRLAEEASNQFGWALLTTMSSANPFNVEGYKTIAYEVVQDVGTPDVVAVPVGSGTLALGVWKGFKELHTMGLVDKPPRLLGIQPENVAPISLAYERNVPRVAPVTPKKTVATGTVVEDPGIAGDVVLQAIHESEGWMVTVSEREILEMWASLPAREGVFTEPTGALALAGTVVARTQGKIKEKDTVICINSASGFKDIGLFDKKVRRAERIFKIPPKLEAIEKLRGVW
ncbi:MAG: hypothetical protein DRH12_08960 [Deltaproteobacteria bacterium]|nr:MAG: hypothetical protein DRH12_08960 [Deltaproteobacteria bacterium]